MQTLSPDRIASLVASEHGTSCYDCGGPVLPDDVYCAYCGTSQTDTFARLVTMADADYTPFYATPQHGAQLARTVREWLKRNRFADDTRVLTRRGRVIVYLRGAHEDPARECPRSQPATYGHRCERCERAAKAERALSHILNQLAPGHAGVRNDAPGADYPYTILPDLDVSLDYWRQYIS